MSDIDLPDGEYTAVVDSIEDDLATVFFERDDEEVGNAVLEVSQLPSDAQHADAILSVTLTESSIKSTTYKPEETTTRAEAAQDRFDRLSERPPSDEDG